MAIIIAETKLSPEDFNKAKQDYATYIKITIDIDRKIVILGGEYHADAEKLLLENGSRQENIWGGGINLETKQLETGAIINLRPKENPSVEILDEKIRKKFLEIAQRILKGYV